MKQQEDYIRDISDIRSMMERTTKFLSLSGWAGIMAGIYALIGVGIAYKVLYFNPDQIYVPSPGDELQTDITKVVALGIIILILAIGTAIYLSKRKAIKRNEEFWNAASKRLLINMAVPLVTGGVLTMVLISKGLIGLILPVTLIFYGLSLYIAGKYTYEDVKALGIIQIALGLLSSYFIGYSLLFWALGFGIAHICYGIYIHFKYEK